MSSRDKIATYGTMGGCLDIGVKRDKMYEVVQLS